MRQWMNERDGSLAGTRLSRREFNAVCQVALVPAFWPWAGLSQITDGAISFLQEAGQPRDSQLSGQASAGVTALLTNAILRILLLPRVRQGVACPRR